MRSRRGLRLTLRFENIESDSESDSSSTSDWQRHSILKRQNDATHFFASPFNRIRVGSTVMQQQFAGVSTALPGARVLLMIPMAGVGMTYLQFY